MLVNTFDYRPAGIVLPAVADEPSSAIGARRVVRGPGKPAAEVTGTAVVQRVEPVSGSSFAAAAEITVMPAVVRKSTEEMTHVR